MSEKLAAQCHCGAVTFSVELLNGFNGLRRCNCSYCRMRGAVMAFAPLSGITVLSGQDKLSEYRFNTRQAAHFFCSVCGIYTFHQRRSDPSQYAVNVACLAGISPFDFHDVDVVEGAKHVSEGGGGLAGRMKFFPK